MLEGINQKILTEKNLLVEVNVAKNDDDDFTAFVKANLFNPDKFVTNGGPVTIKAVTIAANGKSFEEAQINGLNTAALLLGL